MIDKDDMNYCRCGEYLAPGKATCDDPEYGCRAKRPGLYCFGDHHEWVQPARGHCVQMSDLPARCPTCQRERFDIFRDRIDWKKRDKAYWKQTFIDAREKTYQVKLDWVSNILDTDLYIKLTRYNERRPRATRGDDPIDDYGPIIGRWLKRQINGMVAGLDDNCIDNVRFAKVSKRKDVRRYNKAKDNGCCGYYDTRIKHVLFGEFLIGCNYGH